MTEEEAAVFLGVAPGADRTRIAKAFRDVARECHPDANGGDAAKTKRFVEAAEAWRLLERRLRHGGGAATLSATTYVELLTRARSGACDLLQIQREADAALRRLPPDGLATPTYILRIHVERLRSARSQADAMRIGREALRGHRTTESRGVA